MVTLALSEPLDRRLEVPVTWTLAANLGPGEFFPLSGLSCSKRVRLRNPLR